MSRCTRCLTVFGSAARLPGPAQHRRPEPAEPGRVGRVHAQILEPRESHDPGPYPDPAPYCGQVPPVAGSRRPRQAGEEGQVMQLSPSAHTDTFCRDHLPPPEQWPEFSFPLPELRYPDRINCATELLDTTITRHGADRPCLLSPSGDWTYAEVLTAASQVARVLREDFGIVPG